MPDVKVTDAQKREIAARYAAGGLRQIDLAAEYGVNRSTISKAHLRHNGHLPYGPRAGTGAMPAASKLDEAISRQRRYVRAAEKLLDGIRVDTLRATDHERTERMLPAIRRLERERDFLRVLEGLA